ncbi:DUF3108 domain-containing protein [Ectothiorhodospira shaposhnikovii]|uniref:DUF3108 domain-containing protein n=1 Tax=Ectothiorhodospira shaposhnikovii TaxID=1054 RepID=UPI001EE877A4|nr:DUF3108 domain-containing protein [Ectothiorhodospira shaposhnikovii]MCG5511547.1 DUF3108 domain-containing protein [Ectothiorhodospira shaposhnikovii]
MNNPCRLPFNHPPRTTDRHRIRRIRRHRPLIALVLTALLAAALVPAAQAQTLPFVPPSYTAEYRAQKMGLSVVARITLTREGERLRYRARVRPTGMLSWVRNDEIIEQSILRLTPAGLRSEEYLYSHTGASRDRRTEIRFDWEALKASGTHNGRAFELDIPDRAIDRFALQLSMIHDVWSGQREFTETIVERNRIRTYEFTVGAPETIDTPMGAVEAIPVTRYNEERDTTVSTWFAPRLNYLPVRLEQLEDGERLVLTIQSVEWHDNR